MRSGSAAGSVKTFARDQAFQRRQPMLVVMRAVVGLAAIFGRLQLGGQLRRPFFPREVALLGELDGERESLRLPGLGEDGAAFVARQPGKSRVWDQARSR